MTERPSSIRMTKDGLLHSETGPSIVYPDGLSVWSWRGTRVPREWIEDSGSVSPDKALSWENIEQRRALCDILGWDVVIQNLSAKTIDKDRDPLIGELIEVDLPDSPATRFLRVRCPTGRDFVLGVPSHVTTALQAQSEINQVSEETMRGLQAQT